MAHTHPEQVLGVGWARFDQTRYPSPSPRSLSRSPAQDVGGQDKIRPLWRHYYTGTQGLIFVVDCSDKERIEEAKKELHKIISDREMKDAIILVFANKQDLKGALSPEVIPEMLDLNKIDDRNWYVQPCVATTGDGLQEGLTWMSTNHTP